jgi:mannose/cellobiose epimerase-like protein (N-acyl-D-glucosamine 2-epimerase family)
VFDAVSAQGLALATSKLLWPQTEYIKACLARYEVTKNPSFRELATSHMKLMRDHFFRSDGANWVNHVARDGAPLVTQTPARVLYHLFLAASELIRMEEA